MNQQDYWNGPGAAKTFTTPVRVDLLAGRLSPSARILDYGCGHGRALVELSRAGFTDLTGADHSDGLLERARKAFSQEGWAAPKPVNPETSSPQTQSHAIRPPVLHQVRPGDFPFADESFDAMLLLAVLTCLAKDEDLAALVAQARRVLKPGGLLLVNDFLLNNDQPSRERYAKYSEKHGNYGVFELPDGALVRHFAPEYLDALFAGWEVLEREETEFTTMNGNTRKGITLLLRK